MSGASARFLPRKIHRAVKRCIQSVRNLQIPGLSDVSNEGPLAGHDAAVCAGDVDEVGEDAFEDRAPKLASQHGHGFMRPWPCWEASFGARSSKASSPTSSTSPAQTVALWPASGPSPDTSRNPGLSRLRTDQSNRSP